MTIYTPAEVDAIVSEAFEMTLDPDITSIAHMREYINDHYTEREIVAMLRAKGYMNLNDLIMESMDYVPDGKGGYARKTT